MIARCLRCKYESGSVKELLDHIREEHAEPDSSGAGDQAIADWSAQVEPPPENE